GVVVRLAGRVLLQDVEGTVREITADIIAGNTKGGGDRTGRGACRDSVRAVRCRDLRLAGLADVEEPPEAMPLRSNIAHLQNCLARELLLKVEVVVLHVGSLDVAIESENIALEAIRW